MLNELFVNTLIFDDIYNGKKFTIQSKHKYDDKSYLLLYEVDSKGALLKRMCIVKLMYCEELKIPKNGNYTYRYILVVDIKNGFRFVNENK